MNTEETALLNHAKLTRHDRAILALLQYPSVPKAAEALGIHAATLWRWLKKPAFQKKLHEARCELFSQCLGRLQQGSSAATSTLFRVMTDQQAPASSRVRAAECILKLSQAGLDREDLLFRIAQLEAKQSEDDEGEEQ